jgi:hypothetical protein
LFGLWSLIQAFNEIVGSAFQLVLIPDLFALDAPIVFGQVLQFFKKRITLLDAREWEIPEQMVNAGMETGPLRGTSLVVTPSFFNLKI